VCTDEGGLFVPSAVNKQSVANPCNIPPPASTNHLPLAYRASVEFYASSSSVRLVPQNRTLTVILKYFVACTLALNVNRLEASKKTPISMSTMRALPTAAATHRPLCRQL